VQFAFDMFVDSRHMALRPSRVMANSVSIKGVWAATAKARMPVHIQRVVRRIGRYQRAIHELRHD
jgi:hypothetical protein